MPANASKHRIINFVHTPVNVTLQRSAILALALACGYLLPVGVLAATSIPFAAKLICAVALLLGAGFSIREHVWHARGAVEAIVLRPDNAWRVRLCGSEQASPARLQPRALVLPWLTVLRFELPGAVRRSAILTVDNVDPDAFRQLRVRLRCSTLASFRAPGNPQFAQRR